MTGANDLLLANSNPLSLPRPNSGITSSKKFLEIPAPTIIIKKFSPNEILGEGFIPGLESKNILPVPPRAGSSMVNAKWKGARIKTTAHSRDKPGLLKVVEKLQQSARVFKLWTGSLSLVPQRFPELGGGWGRDVVWAGFPSLYHTLLSPHVP